MLAAAVAATHPQKQATWVEPQTRYAPPLGGLTAPNKVGIAEAAVEGMSEVWDVDDLRERVEQLAAFLDHANS